MEKTIITVVGKDQRGIIAGVCTFLAENGVNILDITQTIVDGFFNMMTIVDTAEMKKSHVQLSEELEAMGQSLGVQIKAQREEIFNKMHRI